MFGGAIYWDGEGVCTQPVVCAVLSWRCILEVQLGQLNIQIREEPGVGSMHLQAIGM